MAASPIQEQFSVIGNNIHVGVKVTSFIDRKPFARKRRLIWTDGVVETFLAASILVQATVDQMRTGMRMNMTSENAFVQL